MKEFDKIKQRGEWSHSPHQQAWSPKWLPVTDKERSHTLPQPHFIAVATSSWDWDELIPPQSMSAGKSSIDIPACSSNSFNRRIWAKFSFITRSPAWWRMTVLRDIPKQSAICSWVIPSVFTCRWVQLPQTATPLVLVSLQRLCFLHLDLATSTSAWMELVTEWWDTRQSATFSENSF